jgi:preprotein translocase subunit YajC
MFFNFANAQTNTVPAVQVPADQVTAAQPPFYMTMVPFVLMIGVFYFLVLRPQAKKQREVQTFLSGLKRGDEVLTTGGILGRIEGLTDFYVTLEIANDVRIKVLRSQIAGSAKQIDSNNKG